MSPPSRASDLNANEKASRASLSKTITTKKKKKKKKTRAERARVLTFVLQMFNPFNLRRPAHSRFSLVCYYLFIVVVVVFAFVSLADFFTFKISRKWQIVDILLFEIRKWRWMVPTLPPNNLKKHIANSIKFPFSSPPPPLRPPPSSSSFLWKNSFLSRPF